MVDLPSRFRAWLDAQGLQATPQRMRVAERLAARGGHLSLVDLQVDPLLTDLGEITVYRAVKLLEEAGLIDRVVLDGVGRFEVAGEHHDHFVCIDCGRIVEFHSAALEALQAEVAAAYGFVVRGHQHVVHVRCGCQA